MVRTYLKKEEGGRKNYSQSQSMQDAYNCIMKKEMSATQAAKHFSVNKKSLLRRVRGEISVSSHVGRSTALPLQLEDEIVECLKLSSEWGWGFSRNELKDVVQEYCTKTGMETPFVDGRPGEDWMTGFLRRHPNTVPHKTEQLSSARARAEDPYVIRAWFDLLKKELTRAGHGKLCWICSWTDASSLRHL